MNSQTTRQREYLDGLFQNMPMGCVFCGLIFDEDGDICDYIVENINHEANILMGNTTDIKGLKGSEYLDIDEFTHRIDTFRKLYSGKERVLKKKEYRHKSRTHCEYTIYLTSENLVTILISNITELQIAYHEIDRKEQVLRTIFDNLPVGVEFYDKNGLLMDVNAKDLEMFGVKSKQSALGVSLFDNPNWSEAFKNDIRTKDVVNAIMVYSFDKVGDYYQTTKRNTMKLQSSLYKIYNSNGQLANYILINQDETEKDLMIENLIKAKDKAQESDRLKSAFLANVSHEIRTPLNSIVGFAELIAETDEDEDKASYFKIVKENSDILLQLITDILDLSKIEAGTLEFNYANVDLSELCSEIVRSFYHTETPVVPIVFTPPSDGESIMAYTATNRLRQVLINFISNSIKFVSIRQITSCPLLSSILALQKKR